MMTKDLLLSDFERSVKDHEDAEGTQSIAMQVLASWQGTHP